MRVSRIPDDFPAVLARTKAQPPVDKIGRIGPCDKGTLVSALAGKVKKLREFTHQLECMPPNMAAMRGFCPHPPLIFCES
ncbi:MAG: hypothetical protein ACRC7G_18290 [Beijerinckiaceae bacterium]